MFYCQTKLRDSEGMIIFSGNIMVSLYYAALILKYLGKKFRQKNNN